MCERCLKWDLKEYEEVANKILKLTDDQIADLFEKVGISWRGTD